MDYADFAVTQHFKRYTDRAKRAVTLAQEEARQAGNPAVFTVHLLYGIAAEGEGPGARALAARGVSVEMIDGFLIGRMLSAGRPLNPPFSAGLAQTLVRAADEAIRIGDPYIGTEHLLFAVLWSCDETDGSTAGRRLLAGIGVTTDQLRSSLADVLTGYKESHADGSEASIPEADLRARVFRRLDEIEAIIRELRRELR